MTDKEAFELPANLVKIANENPILQSLLYDLDLLPEQITSKKAAAHFCIIAAHFKKMRTDFYQKSRKIDGLKDAIENMYGTYDWHGALADRTKVLKAASAYLKLMEERCA